MRRFWFLPLLLLLALPVHAATDVGVFQRSDCTTLTPATGKTYCFDQTANALKLWDGTAWVSVVGGQALPAYTKAGLPAASTAGRLARVTDDIGDIWMDSGLTNPGWISLRAGAVLVTDPAIGAKCDGATDDSTAFATAVSRLPASGGTILIPPGTCLIKNWTIAKSNVVVVGVGSGYIGSLGPTILRAPNGVGATDEVVKISGITTVNVVLARLQVHGDGPNDIDRVGVAIAANSTRFLLSNIVINSPGSLYAFDNKVDGGDADSTDSGGIFDSSIAGKIRIASASFRVERNYFNGNGAATAIKVEGISAILGSPSSIIANNTFDSYIGPILDIGTAGLGAVRGVTITGNKIGSGSVTGTAVNVAATGSEQFTFIGNYVEAGAAVRGLTIVSGSGIVVEGNEFIGPFSGGTGAAILLTTPNGPHRVQNNVDATVEYGGYTLDAFVLNGNISNGVLRVTGVRLTTTDAASNYIYRFTAPGGAAYGMHFTALGQKAAGTSYIQKAAAVQGATQVGVTTEIFAIKTVVGTDALMDVSAGPILNFYVVGEAATTYNWLADIEVMVR